MQSFSATLLQRSIYKAVGGNQRGACMIGLVCQVGTPEMNVREPGMERIHIEVLEVAEEGVESSVDVAGIIDRKHVLRIEVVVILFKRGVEKVSSPIHLLRWLEIFLWDVVDGRFSLRFLLWCNVPQCLHLTLIVAEPCLQ